MASNEQNICNVLRSEWAALVATIRNLSGVMDRLLSRIRSLMDRIVNDFVNMFYEMIRDIRDAVSNFMGLKAIDQAMIRQNYCQWLYKCKPALDLLIAKLPKDMKDWLRGSIKTTTPDWSKYGMPPMTFHSRYEFFEYYLCRLSLNDMFNHFTDYYMRALKDYIERYKKYITSDWLLHNTVIGRNILVLCRMYRNYFRDNIFPLIDKLLPYLDCAFATCDFGLSTQNFLDDFKAKYFFDIHNTPNPADRWTFMVNDMTAALDEFQIGVIEDATTIARPIKAISEEQDERERDAEKNFAAYREAAYKEAVDTLISPNNNANQTVDKTAMREVVSEKTPNSR